jgi:hypothetical protein
MHFGPWEFVAFGSLWIGAFMLAADVGVRMAPTLRDRIPKLQKIQETGWWAFTPLVLLTLAGGVFLYRALGGGLPQVNYAGAPTSFPTWAYVPLALLTVVGVIWLFRQIGPRRKEDRTPAPPLPQTSDSTGRSTAIRAPITRVEIVHSKINQAAPWLEFDCGGYNATGYNLLLNSVRGRIKVGREEFHGQLEFDRKEFMYPIDDFYTFSLKIPLSAGEAELCRRALAEEKLLVIDFVQAIITATATSKPSNSIFEIMVPNASSLRLP